MWWRWQYNWCVDCWPSERSCARDLIGGGSPTPSLSRTCAAPHFSSHTFLFSLSGRAKNSPVNLHHLWTCIIPVATPLPMCSSTDVFNFQNNFCFITNKNFLRRPDGRFQVIPSWRSTQGYSCSNHVASTKETGSTPPRDALGHLAISFFYNCYWYWHRYRYLYYQYLYRHYSNRHFNYFRHWQKTLSGCLKTIVWEP